MATVHLVFGAQGAGKTTYARQLADRCAGTRFSIDEWMGELYAPDLPRPMSLPWIVERVQRCEKRIASVASDVAQRGGHVVLDLGFMKAADRDRFTELAQALDLPVRLHWLTAPLALRRERVLTRNRNQGATFAFEVTPAMFDFMEPLFEPPTVDEMARCEVVHTA